MMLSCSCLCFIGWHGQVTGCPVHTLPPIHCIKMCSFNRFLLCYGGPGPQHQKRISTTREGQRIRRDKGEDAKKKKRKTSGVINTKVIVYSETINYSNQPMHLSIISLVNLAESLSPMNFPLEEEIQWAQKTN